MVWQNLDTVQRPSNGGTLLTSWGDQVNDDANFLYGDIAWTAPTFANGWTNFAAGYNLAGFRLIGTRVFLRGMISSGTVTASAFTLPAGYRPTGTEQFSVTSNGAFGLINIATTGILIPQVGSNANFSLSGISFDTI